MPASQKKAQITVFAIIAILIVASVSLFFYLRAKPSAVPAEFRPVENYFLGCIENKVKEGADLLGAQAGYIELPKFEAGSEYMPFSSQIDFLGTAVPYWFYISGNNIMKQQVPSLQSMEKQLSNFLNDELKNCDFSEFETKGYKISISDAEANAEINDNEIKVSIDAPLLVSYGDSSARITKHELNVKSKIGKFYKIAKRIDEKQQRELFLENYTLDVLSLYAPLSNVEISCAPKIWSKQQVERDVKEAINSNIAAIKIEGDYYKLKSDEDKYFVVQSTEKTDENVNFLYVDSWPTRFEVWPSEGDILKAEPVGNQQGLGILGFCYVQYHFIYDIAYPVMIQIFDNNELFQFPVIVSISKNKAREGEKIEAVEGVETEICNNKLTEVRITTLNSSAKPIEADIKFKCFDEICSIGKTKISEGEAVLDAKLPQCIGGTIIASAEGYAESKLQIDTNEPANAEMILQPVYDLNVDLFVGGAPLGKEEQAIITFTSGEESASIAYPQQKSLKLHEGYYDISAYVFRKGTITIGSQKTQKCVKVPAKGLGVFFGATREECYDVELPAQTLTQIISGGGKSKEYFTEEMLSSAKKIEISASVLPLPKDINDLQNTYSLLDISEMDIYLS